MVSIHFSCVLGWFPPCWDIQVGSWPHHSASRSRTCMSINATAHKTSGMGQAPIKHGLKWNSTSRSNIWVPCQFNKWYGSNRTAIYIWYTCIYIYICVYIYQTERLTTCSASYIERMTNPMGCVSACLVMFWVRQLKMGHTWPYHRVE